MAEKAAYRSRVEADLAVAAPDERARIKRDNEVFALAAGAARIEFDSPRRHV